MSSTTTSKKSSHLRKKSKTDESPKRAPKSPGSPRSPASPSDPVCAICLGKHENKCFTNSCLHEFCFNCLLEWSKVKAECPLCKQQFTSIIHNIRSNSEYDEHKIDVLQPQESEYSAFGLIHRFRYRTTVTPERREFLALQRRFQEIQHIFFEEGVLPPAGLSRPRNRLTGTSNFRRQRYLRDLWVRPLPDITNRFRDSTPDFFRQNPAGTQRLIPWLNRELNVLLPPRHANRLSYVLNLVVRLLPLHHICSRSFREALEPYLAANTEHFVHELNTFARSPYDMAGFDDNAVYEPRHLYQHEEVAVSESSDEEPDRSAVRVISEIPLPPSPQPGPSGLGRSSNRIIDDGQSYTAASSASTRPTDEDDDDEDIEIVEVVRPRTPEVITLDSESGGEESHREVAAASSSLSSSRGKALKTSSPSRDAARRDKKLKPAKRKKHKRLRSSSSESSESRDQQARSANQDSRSRSKRPHQQQQQQQQPPPPPPPPPQRRYWDMDPEELRDRLHGNRSRSHKRKW